MYDLDRFIKQQQIFYNIALEEIKAGYKSNHWMWFIFPQLKGLGTSPTADYYGISSLKEAQAYYENEYLKKNLIEICKALLSIDNRSILDILGYPDNLKLKSCMTLFELVDPEEPIFKQVLEKYYTDARDEKTLELVKKDIIQ